MRHIRLSDTCAELIVSCPLTHLRSEFVPLMAPCWCFIVHIAKHMSSLKEGSQSAKLLQTSPFPLVFTQGERIQKPSANDRQMFSEALASLKHRPGTTARDVSTNSSSIQHPSRPSLSSGSRVQQYLLQNIPDWNNFLPVISQANADSCKIQIHKWKSAICSGTVWGTETPDGCSAVHLLQKWMEEVCVGKLSLWTEHKRNWWTRRYQQCADMSPAPAIWRWWRTRRSFSVRHSTIISTVGVKNDNGNYTSAYSGLSVHSPGHAALPPHLHVCFRQIPCDSTHDAYGLSKRPNEITWATFDLVTSCLLAGKAETRKKGFIFYLFGLCKCVPCQLFAPLSLRVHMIARYA